MEEVNGCSGWMVLELDIKKYFDTTIMENYGNAFTSGARRSHSSTDRKMAECGMMEKGELSYPKAGTPQGGVVHL